MSAAAILPERRPSYRRRLWSVRHARFLETFYAGFERCLIAAAPLMRAIGYDRLERPVAWTEQKIKGALFDCQMCGDCVLSSTGMSCPMNCPKGLRNGPCGGVRMDGNCEIRPSMPCVWLKAFEGSRTMRHGDRIKTRLPPVDHRRKGRSSWLAVARRASEPATGT